MEGQGEGTGREGVLGGEATWRKARKWEGIHGRGLKVAHCD